MAKLEAGMNSEPRRAIIASIRDKDGKIQNIIDHAQFIEEKERTTMMPDVYFCFIIKALIDDFGVALVRGTNGQVNQEQFEAQLIENLQDMLSTKTRENQDEAR